MSDETTRRLAWRGVRSPCPKCTGAGRRGYPGGQTWRGGMGTTLVTWDVCDGCWGSGDADAPGVDLRAMEGRLRALGAYAEAMEVCLALRALPQGADGRERMNRAADARLSETAAALCAARKVGG